MRKKVVFIIRDGYDAQYICSKMNEMQTYNIYWIIESGKLAKKKKLLRMMKRKRFIGKTFLDLISLVIYDYYMVKKMKKLCGEFIYPQREYYHIDDVNEKKCIEICNRLEPDLIMVYGSGILGKKTIESLRCDIYNIHSSILPMYRNVHSDFWACINGDYSYIGITIFKLDVGVDTGMIAMQKVCDLPSNSKLYAYKALNLKNIPLLVKDFLELYFTNKIVLQQQNGNGSISETPCYNDIWKLWLKEKRKDEVFSI